MSLMKSILAVLVLTAIVSIVPVAHAATPAIQVVIAGSSAQWQSLALGAYTEAGAGALHWTQGGFTLSDARPSTTNLDSATVWVVWNAPASKVWVMAKVDSVVGDRCFFAQPGCLLYTTTSNAAAAGGGKISAALWGNDTNLPSSIQALFTGSGQTVNVAATDIRAEDAAFAICRVNSSLGAGTVNTGDALDGLGYNTSNAAGACPASGAGASSSTYVGTPIKSGYPGAASSDAANVVAFNITGTDPISGTAIPAYTTIEVGAAPIVIGINRQGALANLKNVTPAQLQQVFSGTNCDASAFGAGFSGPINIFVREATSGTMNTTEASLFRHPTVNSSTGSAAIGLSQEANIGAITSTTNPLTNTTPCLAGSGARYRVIGTGESTLALYNSNATNFSCGGSGASSCSFHAQNDGIAYFFFGYGNLSGSQGSSSLGNKTPYSLSDSTSYGYVTVNGVDPIFTTYGPQLSTGTAYDLGQPSIAGELPSFADAGCASTGPCPETSIWTGGLSFPNLRNGSYPAWSLLRLIAYNSGTRSQLTALNALVLQAQKNVVSTYPDYIPYKTQTVGSIHDPGVLVVRSHYQQKDGSGASLGAAPVNSGTGEAGGDMGGEVFTCATATTCPTTTQQIGGFNHGNFEIRP